MPVCRPITPEPWTVTQVDPHVCVCVQGSRQLPGRVVELDGVCLGPLGEHGLLRDEAVPSVGGALMQEVLGALVPAARLVVMVGHLPVVLCPGERQNGVREGGRERETKRERDKERETKRERE